MKKKIFYIIRYSVLQHSNAWKISRETDFETYKKNLFSDERLNLKRSLFQTLTLPCLAEQEKSAEDYETEIVLLVSKQLPSEQLEKINSLQQIVKFTVVEVDENESMYSKITTFISSSVSKAIPRSSSLALKAARPECLPNTILLAFQPTSWACIIS